MAEENAYELVSAPNMISAANKSDSRINLTSATGRNHSEVVQRKPQSAGKMCAMILVALIAVFAILVLAGIVALILFNPQTRESNSEIETLQQQIETLRMTVSQIQQNNASLLQGTIGEVLSRKTIQEMIDSSNQELQQQVNNSQHSIQDLTNSLKGAEQKIENRTLSQIQNIKFIMLKKFVHFELQLGNTSAGIQLQVQTLSEKVNKSAADIQALQWEVRSNNTAIKLDIERSLQNVKSTINATEIQLEEKLVNVTTSLTELLSMGLNKAKSDINLTYTALNNKIANISEKLIDFNLQLESIANQTQSNVEQTSLKLTTILENTSESLAMNISQLKEQVNRFSEDINALTLQVNQSSNVIHHLKQRLNNIQSNVIGNLTGSKFIKNN